MGTTYTTLVEITWDTGVEYYSFHGVGSPSAFYEPYLLRIRSLERESPVLGGRYRLGDVDLVFVNYNQYFTAKKGGSAPGKYFYNRSLKILYGDTSGGLAAMTTLFTGRIQRWTVSEGGEFIITARDLSYDRFNSHVHTTMKVLNTTNFPDLAVGTEPRLVPVVYGNCGVDASVDLTTYDLGGPIPCYLIDTDSGGKWRYVAAQHVCKSVDTVFVYGVKTDAANYTVSTQTYAGISMTVIDFNADPRNAARSSELEVTAAIKGITDTGLAGGTLITNPADVLEHFLLNYTGTTAAEIDSTLFDAAATASAAYACGMPILQKDIPYSDIIEKWSASFLGSFFVTRTAKFGVYIKTTAALIAPALTFTPDIEILEHTFNIESNQNIAATLQYDWLHIWPRDFASNHSTLTISNQSVTLNASIEDQVELWYVRDSATASAVANAYADLRKEEVEYAAFDVSVDQFANVDLNTLVNLTHWQGTGPSGYNAVIVRIYSLVINLMPSEVMISVRALKLRSPANKMLRPAVPGSMRRPVDPTYQQRPIPFRV